MADTKISLLPAAGSFLLADEIPANEAGTTKKVTGTQIIATIQTTLFSTFFIATDLTLGSSGGALNSRIVIQQDNAPTVGSGGAGTSALSVLTGSTNTAGRFQVTCTGVLAGAVLGIVAFDDGPLATAPVVVVCSLSAPTGGDLTPLIATADTYTTSGFTFHACNASTTATYILNWIAVF